MWQRCGRGYRACWCLMPLQWHPWNTHSISCHSKAHPSMYSSSRCSLPGSAIYFVSGGAFFYYSDALNAAKNITDKSLSYLCMSKGFSECHLLILHLYLQASLHARSAFKALALLSPSTWPFLCPSHCSSQHVALGLIMLVPSKSYLPTSSGNARMVTSSMTS